MKRIACLVALVAVASIISVPAASAKDADHHSRHHNDDRHHRGDGDHPIGSVEVVIDGLNNPRQIAVRGSSVYVAEAGTGGNTCFDVAQGVNVCAGFTGSVTRYRHGHSSKVQTGLLSIASPEGDVVGVDALAFKGHRLYGIATGGCVAPGFAFPASVAAAGRKAAPTPRWLLGERRRQPRCVRVQARP